jgi:hypothetical protein
VDAELNRAVSETSRFGDLHTKTYDIELLISGALVFGLSSAPGALDSFFDRWSARVDGLASPAMTYLYLYSQMIVYSMLVTFVAHLCLRGYWIALLGLESVWSDGWKWDRLTIGPFTREHLQRRVTSLSDAINKADDRASVIFAAGALLVVISLHSLVVAIGAMVAGLLVEVTTGMPGARAFFIAIAVAFVPMVVIPLLDKKIGRRFDPHSGAGRLFKRVVGVGVFLSPLRWMAPLQFMFQSRIGERRLSIALGTAAAVLATVLVLGMMFRAGQLRVDGWRYFDAEPSAVSIDPRHYRDSGITRDGRRPTIDSDMIRGPLLRLYLPYRPRRHNPMVAKACRGLAAGPDAGAGPNNAAGAACVGGLYKVSLDGVALAPTYTFTRDADSDYVGVLAYVPTSDLQPGPHELTIDAPGNRESAPREIIRIPFYSTR